MGYPRQGLLLGLEFTDTAAELALLEVLSCSNEGDS